MFEIAASPCYNPHTMARERINWNDIDPVLGTKPDYLIAQEHQIAKASVRRRRTRLKIASYESQHTINWDDIDSRLGQAPDAQIAEETGRSKNSIRKRRDRLGIPGYKPEKQSDFTSIDPLLGTRPDSQIARETGQKTFIVYRRRVELNIPAYQRRKIDWESIDHLLGRVSDRELSEQYAVKWRTIQARRLSLHIPAYRAESDPQLRRRLGTCPDTLLAEEFQRSPDSIARLRKKHRIPAYRKMPDTTRPKPQRNPMASAQSSPAPPKRKRPSRPAKKTAPTVGTGISPPAKKRKETPPPAPSLPPALWESDIRPILGTMSDGEVAQKFSLAEREITAYRRKYNIKPYKPPPLPTAELEKLDQKLGRVPTSHLVKEFSVSREWIETRRKQQGIPSYRQMRRAQREAEQVQAIKDRQQEKLDRLPPPIDPFQVISHKSSLALAMAYDEFLDGMKQLNRIPSIPAVAGDTSLPVKIRAKVIVGVLAKHQLAPSKPFTILEDVTAYVSRIQHKQKHRTEIQR